MSFGEAAILTEVTDELEALPDIQVTQALLESPLEEAHGIDATFKLSTPCGTYTYAVEAKSNVTRSTLDAVITQLQHLENLSGHRTLLATNYLPDALMESLVKAKVDFVDAAGNMSLQTQGFYIIIRGRKPKEARVHEAFSATGLKVLYALLAYPHLRESTYRDIAQATGVGLGSVSRTVNSLLKQGYLIKGESALHLVNYSDLLSRWELGYLETLRPKLLPSAWRFTGLTRDEALERLNDHPDVLVGGEEAAARLTHYLKPQTLTLHADLTMQKQICAALKLLPVKDSPDVYLLDIALPYDFKEAADNRLASKLLVRAELLAYGGERLREVANKLLDEVQ